MTQLDDACPNQELAPAVTPPEACWCTQSAAVAVATAPIPDLLLDGEFTGWAKTGTDHKNTKAKAQTKGCSEKESDCDRKRLHVSTCRLGWY